jgi:cyanophycinase
MHVQQGHHADSVGFIRKPHVAMSMLLLPVVRCKPDLTRIFSTGTESGPVVSKASRRVLLMVLAALSFIGCAREAFATSYSYTRVGNPQDIHTTTNTGTAMMGGGEDLDEAFGWLCARGNKGDFLVLRATGDGSYNAYVNGLCDMNSVATLVIPDRRAAREPAVARIIGEAEVVFISGGDQANYIRGWRGTPVEDAINAHIAAGKPLGGTSAGLAVLGEFIYGSLHDKPDEDDLSSREVLQNPYADRVTLVRHFLKIPHLEGLLTDSHFVTRDRMGRTLGFLARIMQDGWAPSPREVAIDERSAVLVEADGSAKIVGKGQGAYFLKPVRKAQVCAVNVPLTLRDVRVQRVASGGQFDLTSWTGTGVNYVLSVNEGKVMTTQPGGSIY